jgi:hypothetical protein
MRLGPWSCYFGTLGLLFWDPGRVVRLPSGWDPGNTENGWLVLGGMRLHFQEAKTLKFVEGSCRSVEAHANSLGD